MASSTKQRRRSGLDTRNQATYLFKKLDLKVESNCHCNCPFLDTCDKTHVERSTFNQVLSNCNVIVFYNSKIDDIFYILHAVSLEL